MGELKFVKDYMDNDIYRKSFGEMALDFFDVDYNNWYQDNLWGNGFDYINYSFVKDDKVIANVSVNKFIIMINGEKKNAIQLGAVMNREEYRNNQLIRNLMNNIFNDFDDKCDFYYLFANKNVTDFYPKFGFKRKSQKYFYLEGNQVKRINSNIKKLDINIDKELINRLCENRVFISNKCGVMNDRFPLMVYCNRLYKDNLYYIEDKDCIVVLNRNDNVLDVYDILSEKEIDVDEVIERICNKDDIRINLKFTVDSSKYKLNEEIVDLEDDTLFIKGSKDIEDSELFFPLTTQC